MSTNIQPRLSVIPQDFDGGGSAIMLVTIYNGNAASTAKLINDDGFQIGFDLPWGATIKPTTMKVLIDSPSGSLKASSFRMAWNSGQPRVSIQFTDRATQFPPGEGFGFQAIFQALAGPGIGMVSASGSTAANRLDPVSPGFMPIAFMGVPPVVPPGTGVNVGGSSTVNVEGGSTVNAGPGSSVNAGGGSTVVVGPGATVVLPPGTNPVPAQPIPTGPNFLQVATLRWYEASGTQRVTLSASPKALLFDGRYIWALLSSGKLARVEPNTGELAEIPLGVPSAYSNWLFEAFVYDGERFWISGQKGGFVANPDGTVTLTTVPPCTPGCILFDGQWVWTANYQQLSRTPTGAPAPSPYFPSFGTGVTDASYLAFDGRHLWIAGRSYLSGQLMSIDLSNGQVGVQQVLPYPPNGLVYDGSSLWLADATGNAVERRALDGSLMARQTTGFLPGAMLFDGAHIWVANRQGASVTKLRVLDNSVIDTFPTDVEPIALAFDGISVWVASGHGCSLTRL